MKVLLSNDDGIHSKGLSALALALGEVAEVTVVAPDREQSAASHAISLHRPLRIIDLGERRWAVDGTPTDAVYLALHHILKNSPPDLVISGINHGANLADDITYSGTVAAAMEGVLLGVPSIAVSLAVRQNFEFEAAAAFARSLALSVHQRGLPPGVLFNVNVPGGPVKGFRFTSLGKRRYGSNVEEKVDPRGRKYYWIGGVEARHEDLPGSDCNVLYDQGLVSVTPLHMDCTAGALLPVLRGWELPEFGAPQQDT